MGMDVYGQDPTDPKGEYFRASVWGWHPLWTLCEDLAPHITDGVEYGHSNDGDGLGAIDAVRLANELTRRLDSGDVDLYITQRQEWLDSLPLEECIHCQGTGTRHDGLSIGRETPDFQCNACGGEGKVKSFHTHYSLRKEFVEEFRDFLAHCGGFKIY